MVALRSRDIRAVRGLLAGLVVAALALVVAAVPSSAVPAQGDVYMRDQASDFGFEPFAGSVWNSPDIKICNVPAPNCVPVPPGVGQTAYLVVTLHNPGPRGSRGPVSGDLKLYYTDLGGAAQWPADWNPIGTLAGVVAGIGDTTVIMQWNDVPGPGHFCLLARWESNEDPMTFAEGNNTVTNTKNNNNIAWKNFNSVGLKAKQADVRPFTIRSVGPESEIGNLVITQPQQFVNPGRLVVDLGATLAARWKAAGSPGVGIAPLGATQVDILNPANAQIRHLPLLPNEKFTTRLLFTAGDKTGDFVVDVVQTNRSNVDIGGARFAITVE